MGVYRFETKQEWLFDFKAAVMEARGKTDVRTTL